VDDAQAVFQCNRIVSCHLRCKGTKNNS
jgi:hypothetical protein